MKIIYLIAGTGSYYCGACLRDHALIQGLRHHGHDVKIAPIYLPLVTDSPIDIESPIFLGGINMFLQQKFAVFRKTPKLIDKFLNMKWMLSLSSKLAGMTKPHDLGELTLSTLDIENGPQVKELEKLSCWLNNQTNVDAVFLSHTLLIGLAPTIKKLLNTKIFCSFQGEDSFLDSLPEKFANKCWQEISKRTGSVDEFISCSQFYKDVMQMRLEVSSDKIHVIYNSIDLSDYLKLQPRGGLNVLGYLSQFIPGKGVETVLKAFFKLKKDPFLQHLKLNLAGAEVPSSPGYFDKVRSIIAASEYASDIVITSNLTKEQKLDFLGNISILSVPVNYDEAFGLYIIEAMASSIPVVQPDRGAFPELIKATNGGVLYESGNMEAYVSTLKSVLLDKHKIQQLGKQGRASASELFDNKRMAEKVVNLISSY